MSGFSDAYEVLALDHFTGNDAWAQPTVWWVSLWIGDPDDGGSECAVGDYDRINASFGAAADGAAANDAQVDFGTTLAAWGEITHFGIHTAETAGALMASGALSATADITTGEAVTFEIGDLTLTLE